MLTWKVASGLVEPDMRGFTLSANALTIFSVPTSLAIFNTWNQKPPQNTQDIKIQHRPNDKKTQISGEAQKPQLYSPTRNTSFFVHLLYSNYA